MPDSAQRRNLLHVETRQQWRTWLEKHHQKEKEIWLVFAKMRSGRRRLRYDEAVEEALCFGWIDTTVNRLDDDHYIQRFTPRLNTRKWSKLNLERFKRMDSEGRMTTAGRAKLPAGVTPPPPRLQSGDPIPPFIERALAKDRVARKNFQSLAAGYRRDYVRWITEAKKAETRERRLKEALRRLRADWKRVHDPSSIA